MIVKCSDCNASYSVDDAKVKNKKFAFTCPKCGSNVIIDNRILQSRSQSPVTSNSVSTIENDFSDDSFSPHPTGKSTQPAASRSVKDQPTSSSDFMDFELASDDEALLKHTGDRKESAIGVAETTISENESLNLDDFDIGSESSAVREEFSQEITETSPSDDLRIDELALDLPAEKTLKSSDKISVDQDDFKPLEEDISFDEFEKENSTPSMEETPVKSEEILAEGRSDDTDESITIDLDTLDIQLDESTLQSEQIPSSSVKGDLLSPGLSPENEDTDESITLDLDSLDITLDEVEEFKEGISVEEEDERLTLDDAGITIDQIEAEKHETSIDSMQENEEELKLSIDEVAPSLESEIASSVSISDKSIISEIDENDLPEIDFDKLESSANLETAANPASLAITTGAISHASHSEITPSIDDNYLDIETKNEFEQYKIDIESYTEKTTDTVPGGAINFSVDYSLSHSRIKSILRFVGLYYILFIPHAIVLLIYTLLSSILAVLDWIIVLFFGYHVEDFLEILAKTVRYLLSLGACATATTDDLPTFSGRKNIDHAIQLDFIYSSNPSRILAALRLSFIGIYLLLLPHYIILALLTLGSFFISFIGIISIIITRRLPNILFDYMVRYFRYLSNVIGYHIGLVDKYPTFRFD